jgi:hypothetical protein
MSTATYTLIHVLISLVGIGSGVVVLYGMLERKRLDGITAIFLATTVLTSVTGFAFPVEHILPSHIVGIISLVVLTVAILARYSFRLSGAWRRTYVITRRDCSLLECLRPHRAVFLKGAHSECARSHPKRAAIPADAAACHADFHRTHNFRRQAIPRRARLYWTRPRSLTTLRTKWVTEPFTRPAPASRPLRLFFPSFAVKAFSEALST